MEPISLCNDGDMGEGGDVEGNVGVCLRSGLQGAVFLSLRGDTVGVVVVITEVGGKGAKVPDSEGGGVERSRAGDNKDKLAKEVSGEIEGSIRVVSGASKC
jgi:hypothetical protein